jgi:DNA replication protein DnaC
VVASMCSCGVPAADGMCDACFARELKDIAKRFPTRTPVERDMKPEHVAPQPPPLATCMACGMACDFLHKGVCRKCQAEHRAARLAKEKADDLACIQAAADATLRRIEAERTALERSPHRCEGGCGAPKLRAGITCDDCIATQQRELARRRAIHMTLETVPERYRWAHLDAPDLPKRVHDWAAIEKARAAVSSGVDRILLTGDGAGVGKTVLATAALLAFVSMGPRHEEHRGGRRRSRPLHGRFADAQAVGMARANSPLGAEPEEVTAAFEADVLVIDELGADKPVHNSPIVEILHRRHARMLVTIVTSGFGGDELAARYGDGIARRLGEGASVIHVRAKGGAPR